MTVMKNFDIFFELLLIIRIFTIPNESLYESIRTLGLMANGW